LKGSFLGDKHQAGFSLIEVVVVMGLMAVAALGFGELLRNTGRQTASVSVSTDFSNLASNIGQVLGQQATCAELMKEKLPGGLTLAAATSAGPPAWSVPLADLNFTMPAQPGPPAIPAMPYNMVTKGQPNHGMNVSTITLQGPVVSMGQMGPPGAQDDVFMIHLYVESQRLGAPNAAVPGGYEIVGAPMSHDFGITLVVDHGTGAIVNCYRDPTNDASVLCTDIGGDWDAGASNCDISPAICRRLGGTVDPLSVPGARKCLYGGSGGTLPVDAAQLMCNALAGTYNAAAAGGTSRCHYNYAANDEQGPTSQEVVCAEMGGTWNPGGANPISRCQFNLSNTSDPVGPTSPKEQCDQLDGILTFGLSGKFFCDFCTNSGGYFNITVDPPYCDMTKQYCLGNGGFYTPPAIGIKTGTCSYDPASPPTNIPLAQNYVGGICKQMGMNWDTTVVPPVCRPVFNVGACYDVPGPGSYYSAYSDPPVAMDTGMVTCNPGYFMQGFRYIQHPIFNSVDDYTEGAVAWRCCKIGG
jgi:prepilin-type N-terminal cleavage/methylation domain-containing protein